MDDQARAKRRRRLIQYAHATTNEKTISPPMPALTGLGSMPAAMFLYHMKVSIAATIQKAKMPVRLLGRVART
jgi:hypothetical protein